MRQSELFTKTSKNFPKDEESISAKLLIRAGFIHKETAGVYDYLPLGWRVLKKVEDIIRKEMNALGGQEVFLTALQSPAVWKKTNRWADESQFSSGLPWFKTKLKSGGELGFASTHEEAMVNVLRQYLSSYKELPVYIYQIQTKFRNELRAKGGLMRTREFLMKDLYSFSASEKEFKQFYEKCASVYLKIFKLVGLGHNTYRTFASGGAFSEFSDEFQTIADIGEDTIYIDEEKKIAVNKEIYEDKILRRLKLKKNNLKKAKSIEIANIFPLGTKYSKALGLFYKDKKGNNQPVVMGSYGIGLGRLISAIVETHNDEKGIIWPETVAPYRVHLLELNASNQGEKVYQSLQKAGVEVLFDDRQVSAGEKLVDADLLGIPWRVIVSKQTKGKLEIKSRQSNHTKYESLSFFLKRCRH